MKDKVSLALTAYRTFHFPVEPPAAAQIVRLVKSDPAFDLRRWRRICARIAKNKNHGRFDLAIADYQSRAERVNNQAMHYPDQTNCRQEQITKFLRKLHS